MQVLSLVLDPTPTPVYNLEVDGTWTYFADGVWVHNNSCDIVQRLWQITREATEQVMKHGTWGKFYKHKGTGLWRAKDKAGHAGSKWKVFKQEADGLRWYQDADEFGDFLVGKHKGPTGQFIPWSDLAGSSF